MIIALHSTKVGDRGALSVGKCTLTVLSLTVTIKTECPEGMTCFVAGDGVPFNEKAYGELRLECFSCECCDFAFALPELLDFVVELLPDNGGVGVALTATPIFPDPCL